MSVKSISAKTKAFNFGLVYGMTKTQALKAAGFTAFEWDFVVHGFHTNRDQGDEDDGDGWRVPLREAINGD